MARQCRIVRDGEAWHFVGGEEEKEKEKEGARRLIFGYHPHGLYPAAACWFHLMPQFVTCFRRCRRGDLGRVVIFGCQFCATSRCGRARGTSPAVPF